MLGLCYSFGFRLAVLIEMCFCVCFRKKCCEGFKFVLGQCIPEGMETSLTHFGCLSDELAPDIFGNIFPRPTGVLKQAALCEILLF